jgi:hypothetical protein
MRIDWLLIVLLAGLVACGDDTGETEGDTESRGDTVSLDLGGTPDTSADLSEDSAPDSHTDPSTPDIAPPDADTTPDVNLCAVERRCQFRIVEACDPATGEFLESKVCERSERCVTGECRSLPEIYGMVCRTAEDRRACEAAGLACGGAAAILYCLHPGVPQDRGELCYDHRDCNFGLRCTRIGRCSAGESGDPCREPEDCIEACSEGSCL